jgi:hypothetical protein
VAKLSIRTVICGFWLLAVAATGLFLITYENTAGPQVLAQSEFPKIKNVQLATDRCTLLLFAHPKCPCTRATISELNRLLTHCSSNVAAHVFFLKPSTESSDWVQTDLWRSAANIPGVQVHVDEDSALANRLGASTSGDVVLFSPQGKLLFHGGITSGRGHEGDNAGETALVALATGSAATCKNTPVYGCLLRKDCNADTSVTQQ